MWYTAEETDECVDNVVVVDVRFKGVVEYDPETELVSIDGGVIVGVRLFCWC